LPARVLKYTLKRGLKLSLAFKKAHAKKDTRHMDSNDSAEDFDDIQPRRSLRKASTIIACQQPKSTSTKVKDSKTKTIQKTKVSAIDNRETSPI
jgi:hypothetical protein